MNLLSALKLKDTKLEIQEKWQAVGETYRQNLRRACETSIRNYAQFNSGWSAPENLHEIYSDLNRTPTVMGLTCSISHCPLAGGFAFAATQEFQLGLDLEDNRLVQREVVSRISSAQEVETAPGLGFLWAAKEATFKSLLGPHQPTVMSAVRLVNWQQHSDHVWLFEAELPQLSANQLQGAVEQQNDLIVGLTRFST